MLKIEIRFAFVLLIVDVDASQFTSCSDTSCRMETIMATQKVSTDYGSFDKYRTK